jgi:hypothetical protein
MFNAILIIKAVMIPVWGCPLVSAMRGSKNKTLITMLALLTLYAVSAFVYDYIVFVLDWANPQPPYIIFLLGVSSALCFGCFNLSHAMLAAVYHRISSSVPKILTGNQQDAKAESRFFQNILFVLNIAMPVLFGVFQLLFADATNKVVKYSSDAYAPG